MSYKFTKIQRAFFITYVMAVIVLGYVVFFEAPPAQATQSNGQEVTKSELPKLCGSCRKLKK